MKEFDHLPEQEEQEERERQEEQKQRAAAWRALVEKLKREEQQETVEQALKRLQEAERQRLATKPQARADRPFPEKTPDDWAAMLDREFAYTHRGDVYTRNAQGQIAFHRVYEFLIEDTPPGQELLLHNGGYPFPLRQRTNFLTYYATNAGYTAVGEPTILSKTTFAAQLPTGPAIFLQDPPRPEMQATQVRPLSTVRYVFSYPHDVAPRPSRPGASLSFLPAEQLERQRGNSIPTRLSTSRP